ncbi:MAG TPA: RagB/SusD family nutrient uptake outer membrane protein, partial [Chitinophagaceae bacterium]
MKKQFKYILTLGLCGVMFGSCNKDYLDPVPQTSITDATSFDTPDRILNQVRSIYGSLKNGNFYGGRYVAYGDIRGENWIKVTTNLVTGADVWQLNPTNSSTNSVRNLWAQAYATINNANLFIDGMNEKGTAVVGDALANNYIAEARFIRALAYYSLLQYYARPYADGDGSKEGLPLRLTGIKGPGASDLERSSVQEVYDQIIADLDFAETNLPASYATATLNVTRAHKNTAISFKTRVYLTMGGTGATAAQTGYLNKVITEANKIVPQTPPFVATSGVAHALQASPVTPFRTYTTTESILSMPMTTTAGDFPGTQNQLGFYFYNNGSVGSAEYRLNPNGIVANTNWSATDLRRTGLLYTHTNGNMYSMKYITPSPYTDWVPVMRWAEVLLNLAEALARTDAGVNARAVLLLNAVRQRSDPATVLAPATKQELIDAILLERNIEFLAEGLRNNDLMRLLQTIPAKGSVPAKAPTEVGYIWPIS